MYVCNCNGLRRREVVAAIEAGARSAREVHRRCGGQTQCGKCLPEIAAELKDRRATLRHAAE
jgi:bacterioferritin-associated ferredoxin